LIDTRQLFVGCWGNETLPTPRVIRTPGYSVAFVSHWPFASRGRLSASAARVWIVPLTPRYAPVPEPVTIGIGAVAEPLAEQVAGSIGSDSSLLPTAFTLIAKEPFDSSILDQLWVQ
jgi:hypothetical protein